MISSVSYSQDEIMENIINLHIPSKKIDCDPTYSKGFFYKKIQSPPLKFDLYPQVPGVICANCINLPLRNNSINSLCFDPPFVAGSNAKGVENTSIIRKRFSEYKTVTDLWSMYNLAIKEFYRVLSFRGILIFKCQDTVSGGKQHWSHNQILKFAEEAGFYGLDLFILLAKSRLSNWKRQIHARKFHSYFWVFRKDAKR